MSVLIGSLIGFVSSSFPDVLKYFQAQKDHRNEVEIMKLQNEFAKSNASSRLEEITMQSSSLEQIALIQSQKKSGIKWLDGYTCAVRPTITYLLFFLYIFVKIVQYQAMPDVVDDHSLSDLAHIWTENDQIFFATVMSFWFGSRSWKIK